MTVGKMIKSARKARKMTQAELAAALGKSVRMVQQYESGEAIPPVKMIPDIADVLGIAPAPLYEACIDERHPQFERHPDIEKIEKSCAALIDYIHSLGYIVNKTDRNIMISINDMRDEYKDMAVQAAAEYGSGEFMPCCEYDIELIKDGVTVLLRDVEFDDLEQEVRMLIGFFIWRKLHHPTKQ